uniref:Oxysterol binding protein like 10 n=1 Tax=Astyanax mexicanus TaxID=7994 RepID=W5LMB6_ASTMX
MEKTLHAGLDKASWARRTGRSAQGSAPGSGSSSGSGSGCGSPSQGSMGRRSKAQLEGVLSKYTNLLQGWQNRYFVLDPELSQLQYFVSEQGRSQKPRGSLPLIGASVTPSDEAPHMFIVSSANGELFKLRGNYCPDITIRECIRNCFSLLSSSSSPGVQRHHSAAPSNIITITHTHHKSPAAARRSKAPYPHTLLEVKEAEARQKTLVQSIDGLPRRGSVSCLDQDLLLLKATSAATLSCLGECLSILQHSHAHSHAHNSTSGESNTDPVKTLEPSPSLRNTGPAPCAEQAGVELVSPSEEVMDTEENVEEELGVLDDQRSVILHLLSQLKLGMDLTRVVLPTFILEKRSLLEMYANFMAHPDLFLAVSMGASPEERMVRFVEYYLTSFHEGRKGAVAKKPYNPILGETFHCSWEVPRDRVRPLRTQTQDSSPGTDPGEAVSHHPPVSAFYCECRERAMCVNVHIWTKSKFMGMSVGVSMVGEGVLSLLDHDEEYVFTLPSAYARSILTVPWVELGGKISISCVKSGYSATVTFHTKPFYGGKVHRVTAEVKQNSSGTIVCKAQGEWNGTLEFSYSSAETKVIETSKLPVIKKLIRPVEKQSRTESRRLWQHVTRALKEGNIDEATEHKHQLEEGQREEEKQRTTSSSPCWTPKHFTKQGDGWVYNNPLWKTH